MLKNIQLLILAIFFMLMLGCLPVFGPGEDALLSTGNDDLDFVADCAVKGMLVQVTIDPINNEKVSFKCVPRFPATDVVPTTG